MKRSLSVSRACVFVLAAVTVGACSRSNEPFLLPPPAPYEQPAGSPWAQRGANGEQGGAGRAAPEPAAAPAQRPAPTPAPAPAPAPAPPGGMALEQIRASHVLVMHRDSMRVPPGITRSKEEARARAEQVLARARGGADFAALAGEMSDEPGHETRRGDLGSFGRGSMVAPFEAAAFALRPGQISDIVETPFGYHVIRRAE